MLVLGSAASADILPPLDGIPYADGKLPQDLCNAFTKTVALAWAFRPYEPATPLGTKIGLNVGAEVTLAKIPGDLDAALKASGLEPAGSGSLALPVLPVARFHLHKGMGERVDLGLGAIYYQGIGQVRPLLNYDASLKVAVYVPEEGPVWATRFTYSHSKIWFIDATAYEGDILVSRALDYADPYIGIGGQYATGSLQKTLQATVAGHTASLAMSGSGIASAFVAFTGVQFKLPAAGLELTVEGSYSTAGVHTLGTKIGLGF